MIKILYIVECHYHVPDIESDDWFVFDTIAKTTGSLDEAKQFCQLSNNYKPHDKHKWWWFVIREENREKKTSRIAAIYSWDGKDLAEQPIKGYKK